MLIHYTLIEIIAKINRGEKGIVGKNLGQRTIDNKEIAVCFMPFLWPCKLTMSNNWQLWLSNRKEDFESILRCGTIT